MISVRVMKFIGKNFVCLALVSDKVWSAHVGSPALKGEPIRSSILVKLFPK